MRQKTFLLIFPLLFMGLLFVFANSCKENDDDDFIIPVLATSEVTDITETTAKCGGNITSDGGTEVTARGVCWSTTQSPTISDNKTTDGTGVGVFSSSLSGLNSETTYYVRAYATNIVGTRYGDAITFTTKGATLNVPVLSTTEVSDIEQTTATSGGSITSDGGETITARGIVWSTIPSPTISDNKTTNGTGVGVFSSSLSGLNSETTYYVRAYATNSAGTSYGNQVNFTTLEVIGDVYNPITGKTWMDRNLGASQVATSSTDAAAYGDLYQWGRAADGHQLRTSEITDVLSNGDKPGHGNFIIAPDEPYDWCNPQNENLWQGVNGINNPCPSGYRLPTEAEWNAERNSWSSSNAAGAFASPLKLVVASARNSHNGSIINVGSEAYYWSSTIGGTYARLLNFHSSYAYTLGYNRSYGFSVRCIKE